MSKKYFVSKEKTQSWITAGAHCRRNGLKFISLETSEEQSKFFNNLENIDQRYLSPYVFVGATTKKVSNNQYDWILSETGQKINYSINWAPGQPNNIVGERCMGASKSSGNWRMHDVPCENFSGKFYCQK